MKVLLAGASGALGVTIARHLIPHGHEVLGLTRDPGGGDRLIELGMTPVIADAFDRHALLRALDGQSADAVIHELTALRKPPLRHSGMALTDQLRSVGTTNLLAAAQQLGARRFLTQSFILGYGYRDHGNQLLTEEAAFGIPQGDACDPHLEAMRSTEQQTFTAPEGIALRYGLLYGGNAEQMRHSSRAVRCPSPAAACSVGFTTRTPRPQPSRLSSMAGAARHTTSSMTGRPPGRRCSLRWRGRSALRRRGGCLAGSSGSSRRTWPRSLWTHRCGCRPPRLTPNSAGGPPSRPTSTALPAWSLPLDRRRPWPARRYVP